MVQTNSNRIWNRAIILVDMNAFFASIEQLDFPELQGQPIGITNGWDGTTIITCSYEARAFGIKTGMRVREPNNFVLILLSVHLDLSVTPKYLLVS